VRINETLYGAARERETRMPAGKQGCANLAAEDEERGDLKGGS